MALARLAGLAAPLLRSRSMAGVVKGPVCTGGTVTEYTDAATGKRFRVHTFGTGGQGAPTVTGTLNVAQPGAADILVVGPASHNTVAVWTPGGVIFAPNFPLSVGSYTAVAEKSSVSGSYIALGASSFQGGSVDLSTFFRYLDAAVSSFPGVVNGITGSPVTYGKANSTTPGSSVAGGGGSYSGIVIVRYEI